uniref:Uncharacterized protein n=1 Tax=Trichuris muris TaxID=70415 RepID=A0A5S6QDI3_TRIMR
MSKRWRFNERSQGRSSQIVASTISIESCAPIRGLFAAGILRSRLSGLQGRSEGSLASGLERWHPKCHPQRMLMDREIPLNLLDALSLSHSQKPFAASAGLGLGLPNFPQLLARSAVKDYCRNGHILMVARRAKCATLVPINSRPASAARRNLPKLLASVGSGRTRDDEYVASGRCNQFPLSGLRRLRAPAQASPNRLQHDGGSLPRRSPPPHRAFKLRNVPAGRYHSFASACRDKGLRKLAGLACLLQSLEYQTPLRAVPLTPERWPLKHARIHSITRPSMHRSVLRGCGTLGSFLTLPRLPARSASRDLASSVDTTANAAGKAPRTKGTLAGNYATDIPPSRRKCERVPFGRPGAKERSPSRRGKPADLPLPAGHPWTMVVSESVPALPTKAVNDSWALAGWRRDDGEYRKTTHPTQSSDQGGSIGGDNEDEPPFWLPKEQHRYVGLSLSPCMAGST